MFESLKFWKSSKRPAQPVRVITREPWQVTMNDWRSTPQLVGQAAGVLKSPTIIMMLQTLRNSHLVLHVLPDDRPLNERVVQQCRVEGYNMCLNDLELLGQPTGTSEAPEAEFVDEQIPEDRLKKYMVQPPVPRDVRPEAGTD